MNIRNTTNDKIVFNGDTQLSTGFITLDSIDYYVECSDDWFQKESTLTLKNCATDMNEENKFNSKELDEIATYVLNQQPYI